MRILLAEYVTGGGPAPETPGASLIAEGLLMRDALVADLAEIPGTTVAVLHDERLGMGAPKKMPRVEYLPTGGLRTFAQVWKTELARCQAAWPIAPESDGALWALCRDAESAGRALLTSPASAVARAASKMETATTLARCGVPVVRTQTIGCALRPDRFPVVVKPDDGAGCAGIRIVRDDAEWQAWTAANETEGWVFQPLLEGAARSLSALFANGQAHLLSCNAQGARIACERFELEACTVNLGGVDWASATQVAVSVAAAMPELWGYAGIDFVETAAGPIVLEVNPRLTTSYVGLRPALGLNVGALVLDLWQTGALPSPARHRGCTVRIDIPKAHD